MIIEKWFGIERYKENKGITLQVEANYHYAHNAKITILTHF
jgi:hypothetical protein